ncbi:hypothetical protein J2W37_003150 [Variovorax paradoxus]|nr:hypothetical protein [Variovorax paradoxus]
MNTHQHARLAFARRIETVKQMTLPVHGHRRSRTHRLHGHASG